MDNKKKALIIIDFINDFVKSDGKLTCGKPAQDIDCIIAQIAEKFAKNGDFIVTASDYHIQDDVYSPEYKLFPAHCIAATEGRQLYGETRQVVEQTDSRQLIEIDKIRYSAFASTGLDLKLRERDVTEIYLVGVCSDICVLHTAVDAYNLGYSINVYANAIASFNAEGHAFALSHFKNTLGANVIEC